MSTFGPEIVTVRFGRTPNLAPMAAYSSPSAIRCATAATPARVLETLSSTGISTLWESFSERRFKESSGRHCNDELITDLHRPRASTYPQVRTVARLVLRRVSVTNSQEFLTGGIVKTSQHLLRFALCGLASGLLSEDRNSDSASRKNNKMIESTKVSSPVEQLAVSRKAAVHDDDTALGTLAYLNAKVKTGAHRCVSSASLCFIRGTGRIAINNTSLAYHDGKWFEIPGGAAHQIFPDTDTVMLTIQKSAGTSVDVGEERSLRRLPSTFGRPSCTKA
jgi:hypothetical protein